LSEDDPEKLAPILKQLAAAGEDVEEVGWDDESVKQLLGQTSHTPDDDKEDEAPVPVDRAGELQNVWSTEVGQLWLIPSKSGNGVHRVLCGDCRKQEDVNRLMDGRKVNVAFTSPPYASQRKYDEESGFKPIKPDEYVAWFEAVQARVRGVLTNDGSWFVNIKEHCEDGQRHLYVKDLTIAHVRQWGWRFVDELIWRRAGVPGEWPNRFKNSWEPVFHYASGDIKFRPDHVAQVKETAFKGSGGGGYTVEQKTLQKQWHTGNVLPDNIIEASGVESGMGHTAAFPVALPTFFIKAYSDPGDLIFDPFLGSGTTLIAAEREGRIGYGTEISPKYVAVILQRAKDAGMSPRLADV
jgi:site-specific DNA-methyltransferase (adenine-specific)/site-specific DNA-methyltransferase (cytosine-N4-specific)